MLQPWVLIFFSLIYIGILFAIAYYGDKQKYQRNLAPYRSLIYSLSLAVYCTSWTYYGAVGNASTRGWEYFAIYLGPIFVFFFGYKFLKRVARICIDNNITTIADFIASRYGKAQSLAILVTVIAIMGTLPYIALQLKAVASSYEVIASFSTDSPSYQESVPFLKDTGFVVAVIMAVFSILFGTRYVHASEHHEGIILAIAFESLVKLLALIGVCVFAVYVVFDGPKDILANTSNSTGAKELLSPSLGEDFLQTVFIGNALLAMAAIFCLPRQFHVTFVEVDDTQNMQKSRWMFPLYLIITSLVVIPIAISGLILFEGKDVNPDMFVLMIPMTAGNETMTLLVFLGGFSAATGMVIVAVITLSTMICNDIVMPVLFKISKFGLRDRSDITGILLLIRRLAIVVILLLSYFYYQYISAYTALASIGLIAFVAAAQFAPAIIGGVYWKKATRQGATIGLIAGFVVWFYTLFLPTLAGTGWLPKGLIEHGLFGLEYLKPYALFGFDQWTPITHSLILSLMANISCYVYFSLTRKSDLLGRIQAAKFTQAPGQEDPAHGLPWWSTVAVGELRVLAEKFIGERSTKLAFAKYAQRQSTQLFPSEKADAELISFTERLLAGAIGSSSARLIISSVLSKKDLPIEDVFSIVDEASQAVQFNQELLNNTIEHIDQGISVVDQDLKLIAWNSRYLEIHEYPSSLIQVGRPIAEVLKHSAAAGDVEAGSSQLNIEQRLEHMRQGRQHSHLRYRSDGSVIQIQGKPMPGVGYVTSFTDVTELKRAEQELRKTNENLEKIVEGRTKELSKVNRELERAIKSKNKFLTAVNHDVMQPLNAARLFTSALAQHSDDKSGLSEKINSSIRSAEEIIHTLLDISKLDSGGITKNITVFSVDEILEKLADEFGVIAEQRNLVFKYIQSSLYVESDAHLVRRILQNFISNALRYTKSGGRVTVGCRRSKASNGKSSVTIEVHDTGVGINNSNLESVFEEFKRLDNQINESNKGLGVGLAIAKRIANLIDARINVRSKPGQGSVFSLVLPIADASHDAFPKPGRTELPETKRPSNLNTIKVLCIDDDINVLEAMKIQLDAWQCDGHCVAGFKDANEIIQQGFIPEILLVDYHLDNENGIDVINLLHGSLNQKIPAILISADFSEELKQKALKNSLKYLHKPISPAALRSLIYRMVTTNNQTIV